MRRSLPACAVAALLLLASLTSAQRTSALINAELDKQFVLDVAEKTPLQQVIKTITEKTGVPISVAPEAWDLLPYGEQTTLKVTIANQTLRGALQAIARHLGLTVELKDEVVELRPLPALKRLGRRATDEELKVLALLSRTPLEPGQDRMPVKQVLAKVDAKLQAPEAKSDFAVEDRTPDSVGNTMVAVARNDSLLDALEAIPQTTEATWYPWGRTLLIRQKADFIRDRLQTKTTTRRFNGVDVGQVLSELQSIAGVDFIMEPGSIQKIPAESRNLRLVLDNASIAQALENIAGFTGLAWSVSDKGVYIWNPSAGGGAGANREPTVGLLMLDNGMQVVVRESQVPPDMREYLRHKTDQQLAKIRQMMNEEGFKPSTQPATPATKPAGTQKSEDL